MNQELQQMLVKKYPTLMRDYGGDAAKTCMCFGIETGDGWFKILDNLFGYLTDHMNRKLYVKYSLEYRKRFKEAFEYAFTPPKIVLDQVKSKYASLRCYYHTEFDEIPEEIYQNLDILNFNQRLEWYNDRIDSAISFAEYISKNTCEITGKDGKLYTGGWWTVLCDEEAVKRGYNLNNLQ